MSLSDKLQAAAGEAAVKACKIGVLLASSQLSTAEKKTLSTLLDTPVDSPARVPNTALGKILREEGFDVSNSAVDRHRRLDCACHRAVIK
jgi:hypothetical protein